MKKIFGILFLSFLIASTAQAENYVPSSAEYPTDGTVVVQEYDEQMQAADEETKKAKSKKTGKKFPRIIRPAIYNPQDLNAGSYYKRRYIGY